MVFPKLAVCLRCGFTEFTVPERELSVLVNGAPVEGAVVLVQRGVRPSGKGKDVSLSTGMNG
jgi:hypothetical protein